MSNNDDKGFRLLYEYILCVKYAATAFCIQRDQKELIGRGGLQDCTLRFFPNCLRKTPSVEKRFR
jgi:hypothetical protein